MPISSLVSSLWRFIIITNYVRFVPRITGIDLDGSYVCFRTTTLDIYS